MGTITGLGDLDPIRWPNSQWRSLKVADVIDQDWWMLGGYDYAHF